MKLAQVTIALASIVVVSQAQASNISFSTGYSSAGAQASAADYLSTVNNAIATNAAPGYGTTTLSVYDGISNYSVFNGPSGDIAFRSTFDFGVSTAGTYDLRFGVDFGNGGAVFLDGTALGFKSTDMWWNGSYADPNQSFQYSLALSAGNHKLTVYGLEGCCDGGQQAQFKAPGSADFVTFGANDGLNTAPVPEPETYAMMMAGLGLIGAMARRKKERPAS